ncbi:SDR family NAD(P)-dependent oxidoreductase [Alteromonas lipotrueiana]|uniref:SDR family NAD(P)-dependent oxidoreductase n=1 Tax=Alteromonas lipotrueiana TaxID=2803815 RepID=UPI001C481841|nr:SDR family NAD(P)-dependent oxidoreductase [Alteromonas lipotrueiana]
MQKTILITGATDGIGLATATKLASEHHHLLLHGRSTQKLKEVEAQLSSFSDAGSVQTYLADLSELADINALAEKVAAEHKHIDVLINNAGIFKASETITQGGLDIRFCVNTIAPFVLTRQLAPVLGKSGRVINLSSAAQSAVNLQALAGKVRLTDMEAYSQSKLAITMWTRSLAEHYKNSGPTIIAVNPGSLLASKMVKDGFGIDGNDINIGADILVRIALEEGFEKHSGQYFDNDAGTFAAPHPEGIDLKKCEQVVEHIQAILNK